MTKPTTRFRRICRRSGDGEPAEHRRMTANGNHHCGGDVRSYSRVSQRKIKAYRLPFDNDDAGPLNFSSMSFFVVSYMSRAGINVPESLRT